MRNELEEHPNIDGMLEAIQWHNLYKIADLMGNVLETVTIPKYPVIQEIKDHMKDHGALNALMSGSGPTVFGLFDDKHTAQQACEALRASHLAKTVFLTTVFNQRRKEEINMELEMHMDEYLPLRMWSSTPSGGNFKGELKPGERLMEIALADKLGVSRTPIREAIRKLELEGLVVMAPRKGAKVASITERDLNDVLEVRKGMKYWRPPWPASGSRKRNWTDWTR